MIAIVGVSILLLAVTLVFVLFMNPLLSLRRSEASRRQNEELLRLMVNGARDYALYVLDADNRVVEWNAGAERLFGYASREILGKSLACTYAKEEVSQQVLTGDFASALSGQFEEVKARLRKDGTSFWAQTLTTVLRDRNGRLRGFAKMTRDVTERRQLEQQLRQAQKMEDFGRLAGGVAHDFNNLLTVINGYAHFLLSAPEDSPKAKSHIEQIVRAGERAAALTRQLLAFSRKQVLEPKILNLNKVLGDMEKMLRRLIGEDVEFMTRLHSDLPRIKADPGQMEQVVMNLSVNARDAMPGGGKLTIETSEVELDESYHRTHPEVRPGRYVVLSVTDTGTGMDGETLSHIFEPFFTTKGPGKGTGLGLSTVFGIVKQSGGHISVYSEVGMGTTFKIYLPPAEEGKGTERKPISKKDRPPRATETVLLVEDEAEVRKLACETLERDGYSVIEAGNGKEALDAIHAHPGPIDLLVTDTVMPVMGGSELAGKASALLPTLKVLFMSGYAETALFMGGILKEDFAFLSKPFTPEALSLKARDVLSSAAAPKVGR